MRKLLLLLALLPSLVCLRANAATYCVDSAASLQAALDTSVANGETDYISMVATYVPLTAGMVFISIEDHSIVLLGGYDPTCNFRVGRTTLDGQNQVRPLYVATNNGRLFISGFNIQRGYTEGSGGGLYFNTSGGNATIQLNEFTGNRSLASGGAFYARSDQGIVFVYNNLLFGNRANEVGGMIVDQAGDGRLINNTIIGNRTDVLSVPSGVLLRGTGHFDASNNIIWANSSPGGADFRADATHGRRNNNIEFVASSVAPDSVSGELSVPPEFVNCGLFCFSFELSASSPWIDAGSDAALNDLSPGLIDLDNHPRVLGPHVDIGAYEFDGEVFANGFES